MKEIYVIPELEVIDFTGDVITTSAGKDWENVTFG